MGESIFKSKSYYFAIRVVVGTVKTLQNDQKEFVLSKQLLRSGTAVGVLISESEFGQSKADFAHKLSIALKEANESHYWLNLLHDTGYLNTSSFTIISDVCTELIRILVASIKTSKNN